MLLYALRLHDSLILDPFSDASCLPWTLLQPFHPLSFVTGLVSNEAFLLLRERDPSSIKRHSDLWKQMCRAFPELCFAAAWHSQTTENNNHCFTAPQSLGTSSPNSTCVLVLYSLGISLGFHASWVHQNFLWGTINALCKKAARQVCGILYIPPRHMPHCPSGLHSQNTGPMIKFLRISKWLEPSIKPSVGACVTVQTSYPWGWPIQRGRHI